MHVPFNFSMWKHVRVYGMCEAHVYGAHVCEVHMCMVYACVCVQVYMHIEPVQEATLPLTPLKHCHSLNLELKVSLLLLLLLLLFCFLLSWQPVIPSNSPVSTPTPHSEVTVLCGTVHGFCGCLAVVLVLLHMQHVLFNCCSNVQGPTWQMKYQRNDCFTLVPCLPQDASSTWVLCYTEEMVLGIRQFLTWEN